MAVEVADILAGLRLSIKKLLAVAVATGFLIFVDDETRRALGFDRLYNEYKPWFGGLFLLSAASFLIEGGAWGLGLTGWYIDRRKKLKRLHDLTQKEKEILRDYVNEDTRTQNYSIAYGVVAELEREGILSRSTDCVAGPSQQSAYSIEPWAWSYLKKHRGLITGR